ncbi:MAG: Hydroxypyruvate reductase [Chloroflexi bacterium]|nr:Hydroxypyruvate reductase [Chloroflexota bacterium]
MKRYKVLVTPRSFRSTPGEHWQRLKEAGVEVIESPSNKPLREKEMIEMVKDVDGMIVGLDEVTRHVIEQAKSLRIIAKYGAGLDNIDLETASKLGITVTYTPGVNAPSVADLALGLILALARHIVIHHTKLTEGALDRRRGREISGKTLGIIGLGGIGKEVVKRALGFDMRILAHDPYPDEDFIKDHGVELCTLERVLVESDVVSLHCPLTYETEGIIGREELKLMKEDAFLINTARKDLVDEDALYKTLRDGKIKGAAFDTFETDADLKSPLLELENFIGSPHAGAATYESIQRMADMAAREVIRALEGKDPLYPVGKK